MTGLVAIVSPWSAALFRRFGFSWASSIPWHNATQLRFQPREANKTKAAEKRRPPYGNVHCSGCQITFEKWTYEEAVLYMK
jgi:hypothetical protein